MVITTATAIMVSLKWAAISAQFSIACLSHHYYAAASLAAG